MPSDGLPNGLLKIDGTRINPSTDESVQAVAGLINVPVDAIYGSYPSGLVEVYSCYNSGVLQLTITVTYTSTNKTHLLSAVRS